jgi:type I protein arginine methyltransferase
VLTASRNDYVHGFVGYFDIGFTQGHTIIGFSTSPMSRYTHWKQTVFYLHNELAVSAGENITVQIKCGPNEKNPRDLDIQIGYEWKGASGQVNAQQEYRLR